MKQVCLVTNELFPLAPGGIGRLVHNFIEINAEAGFPVQLHVLFIGEKTTTAKLEPLLLGKAKLHVIHHDEVMRLAGSISGFPVNYQPPFLPYYQSMAILAMLQRLERRGFVFDVVEFPDIHGWGYCSIAAKRFGHALTRSTLTVRLHSTNGIISYYEPHHHHPSVEWLLTHDIERQCLEAADRVIGHLESIRDFNRMFYELDDAWSARTLIERPPILLSEDERTLPQAPADLPAAVRRCVDERRPLFVFSQRLQPFKRADLFLDGAIMACRRDQPGSASVFVSLSYGWDRGYIEALRRKIPEDLKERILFVESAPPPTRAFVLAHSVAVFPSSYESLCLAAIECLQRGLAVILNKSCLAFETNPWFADSPLVHYFDGTAADLADTFCRVAASLANVQPAEPATWVHDAPYWEGDLRHGGAGHADDDYGPSAIAPADLVVWIGEDLVCDREAVETLLSIDLPHVRVHAVEPTPNHLLHAWVQRLAEQMPERFTFRTLGGVSDVEILRQVASPVPEAMVALIRSRMIPSVPFLKRAITAMRADRRLVGVAGPLLRFPSYEDYSIQQRGELVSRAAFSLAGSFLSRDPLDGGVYRTAALLKASERSLGSVGQMQDAHVLLASRKGLVIHEDIQPAASIISPEEWSIPHNPIRRAGLMRALLGQGAYSYSLMP